LRFGKAYRLDDKNLLITSVHFIWTFYHVTLVYLADSGSNYMSYKVNMNDWSASRATPVGTARAEDPGLSEAREAAEAVPTESVRSKRKSTAYLSFCS